MPEVYTIRCAKGCADDIDHNNVMTRLVRERHARFTVQDVTSLAGLRSSSSFNGYFLGKLTEQQREWLRENLGYEVEPVQGAPVNQ